MQIKCSKCGFENQMGAIFCRQCGEKINMDEISPESLEKGKSKENAGKAAAKSVRWTVRILILLILVGLVGTALAPWGLPVYTAPDETSDDFKKKEEKALSKLQMWSAKEDPRTSAFAETRKRHSDLQLIMKVKFSMEELNILFSKHFLKPGENKNKVWTLEHVVFSEENDRIRMLVFAKLFDFVPVVFRADGMAAAGGSAETPLTIHVDSSAIGHLPLLYCNSFVSTRLAKAFSGNGEIKLVFERAESVSLDDDALVFKFRLPENKEDEGNEAGAKSSAAPDAGRTAAPVSKGKKKSGKKKPKKSQD